MAAEVEGKVPHWDDEVGFVLMKFLGKGLPPLFDTWIIHIHHSNIIILETVMEGATDKASIAEDLCLREEAVEETSRRSNKRNTEGFFVLAWRLSDKRYTIR